MTCPNIVQKNFGQVYILPRKSQSQCSRTGGPWIFQSMAASQGRNKHHFEYWIDFSIKKDDGLVGHKMPLNYVIEMVMDRIAASRIYKGKDYTDRSALEYYQREKILL